MARKKPVTRRKTKPAPKKTSPLARLRDSIAKVIDDNKGEQIAVLDIADQCSFADYMIVASGRAPRHVAALADYVTKAIRSEGGKVYAVEGQQTGDWVLIDAGDIIVHIFRPETRLLYNLEKMWTLPAPTRR